MGGSENIEGALRRVLGEKNWAPASSGNDDSGLKVGDLEKEVLEKDRTIAELNKQLTQSSGNNSEGGGDDAELLKQIAELEARLEEYEIIEDDIADLSLYKVENDKLKDELARLKNQAGMPEDSPAVEETTVVEEAEPEESGEVVAAEEPASEAGENHLEEAIESMSSDLVAEFEKIVDSQNTIATDETGPVETVPG